ncbi:MAG: 2-oxoacid:acceptor oxidoreductase subunit alpha [Methanosarcinales archaeon]
MEINNLTWKMGGEAGYGIMSAGLIFSKTCSRGGLYVVDTNEYPSLIRGGHNTHQVRVSNKEIYSLEKKVNLLVALNRETIDMHKEELTSGGGIIYDGEKINIETQELRKDDINLYSVPLDRLVKEAGGIEVMKNNVALGASVALLDYDFEILAGVIRDTFKRKGEKIIQKNIASAKSGYDYVIDQNYNFGYKLEKIGASVTPRRMVITGAEAISMGAIKAGCKFYAAYPMTPASPILHFMAANERRFNLVVKHSEDEISAIIMAIGAAFAGVRAMTATSGGGFSLMVEGLGLAAMTETPLVVVEGQRPGPSTGMPTWTEQGDLKFLLNASQGDFPRVLIAPGDVEECFYETINAFNIAEKYQMPVIILIDKYLSESHMTTEFFDVSGIKIDRGKLLSDEELEKLEKFNRYEITEDGISPRTIPSQKGGISKVNSDEHDEFGFSSDDPEIRIKMMDKRFRKLDGVKKEIKEPKLYGKEDAEITIIGWGSTKGPILEAMKLLENDGIETNFLHLVYINPFPTNKVSKIIEKAKKTFIVENNKTAQMAGLIRQHTGIEINNKILKYNGRPFFPNEIYDGIKGVY